MSYDLKPVNKKMDWFRFGAFSFPVLLEACGYLFPFTRHGRQWYCVFGADPRMPQGDEYPRLISNDGFRVTEEEARIMARMARNFVAVQRSLPEESRRKGTPATQMKFKKEDVGGVLQKSFFGTTAEQWPVKIRDDFTDCFEKFAEWAEQSGGFEIW